VDGYIDINKAKYQVGTAFDANATFNARALSTAINQNADSKFWAMLDQDNEGKVYVFNKEGGDYNELLACDVYGGDEVSQAALYKYVTFENVESEVTTTGGTNFTLGTPAADAWGVMNPVMSKQVQGNQVWNLSLNGRDVGYQRDL